MNPIAGKVVCPGPLTDFLAFLRNPDRIDAALEQNRWVRAEMTPMNLLHAEQVLCALTSLTYNTVGEWPLTELGDVEHWAYSAIKDTFSTGVVYGVGGFHRFLVGEDGLIRMSAPHTGNGRQVDRGVLSALWLGIPVCNESWREGRVIAARKTYAWVQRVRLGETHREDLLDFLGSWMHPRKSNLQERLENLSYTLPRALEDRIIDYITDPWGLEE